MAKKKKIGFQFPTWSKKNKEEEPKKKSFFSDDEDDFSSGRSRRDDDYDDYSSYGGYGGGYSYSSYRRKSSGSTWNWGSYGSYGYLTDDDDDGIYVKASESYLTPRDFDISNRLPYTEDTRKNRTLIKEMARFFYHKMLDDKDYIDPKYTDPTKLKEQEIADVEAKKVSYAALWDKFIPGVTPLEQALSVFHDLQRKKGARMDSSKEVTNADLMRDTEDIEFHEELYNDPIFNELLDMQELGKQHKTEVLQHLSMIQHLGAEFKIQKEVEERIVQNSSLVTKKIMRDYSQIHNIDLYQRLMPNFPVKLLTKDLIVNNCVERTDHKQKIIILLDFSGSMSTKEKQIWVLALLMDRLRHAMLEEAELYFSYFIHDPNALKFHHIYDRASALKFWAQFSTRPNGGDTRLGDMVMRIKDEIINKQKLCNLDIDLSKEQPEILAINDGQDSVKTNNFVYKTNAVTLVDGMNSELRDLCIKNKGKYVYIDAQDKVTTYPK